MRLINADMLNFEGQHYNKSQMKAILDFIDEQPTAYDVNKVVKQLKERSKEFNSDLISVSEKSNITISTLDHRYSSYNYVTISKVLGQVASELGYPLFCELGKRNMLLKIHIDYKKDNINML